MNIDIIEGDILDFRLYSNNNPELIVCMGGTLTHLSSLNAVVDLIENSYKILSKNGSVFTFFNESEVQHLEPL